MNKVVTVEIAGQVFWIDAQAHDVLQQYLQKIRSQLGQTEGADEIYTDIELRVAELLFELNSDESRAIVKAQLEAVIAQVGYIEDEAIDEAAVNETPTEPQVVEPPGVVLRTIKIVFAGVALSIALFIGAGIMQFSENTMFPQSTTWLLSVSAVYLVVLGLVLYLEKFYFAKPRFNIHKWFKLGAIVPGVIVVFAFMFFDNT